MTKMTWTDLDPSRLCLADLGREERLPWKETKALIARAQAGDREAFDRVVETNGRLVIFVASKYTGVPLVDLCAEGVLGLMRAVVKFDPDKGTRFSTYATIWIRQAVQRAVANHDRRIRIPVHMADRTRRVKRVFAEKCAELGREPTPEEVAEDLPLSARDVRRALYDTEDAVSLEHDLGDDGWWFGATVASDVDVERDGDRELLGEVVETYLVKLSARKARIVRMRFGLDGHEPMTLEQIGARFGLTRERIRQLLQDALGEMRVWAARDFGKG